MTDIAKVSGAGDSGYSTLAGALLLPREAGLASTLTLGQILKGKVLMRHEQDRYTVLFSDKEYVVHSDIKLVINDEIEARVVAIKQDFVHLRKSGRQAIEMEQPFDSRNLPSLIDRISNDYRVLLTKSEVELIQKMSQKGNQTRLVATAKILFFIKKIGLIPTREIMDQFDRLFLVKEPVQVAKDMADVNGPVLALAASEPRPAPVSATKQIQLMSAELKQHIRDLFESEKKGNFDGEAIPSLTSRDALGPLDVQPEGRYQDQDPREKRADKLMLRNLLNIQTETMLAHKYWPITFLFDDQLIEIDLAIFSPRNKTESDGDMPRYAYHSDSSADGRESARVFTTNNHRLTFALETPALGKMQIQVHATNKRLNVEFVLSDESTVEQFIANSPALESHFQTYGWQLDEARYRVQDDNKNNMSFTKRAVVEHYILAGSLSRLI